MAPKSRRASWSSIAEIHRQEVPQTIALVHPMTIKGRTCSKEDRRNNYVFASPQSFIDYFFSHSHM